MCCIVFLSIMQTLVIYCIVTRTLLVISLKDHTFVIYAIAGFNAGKVLPNRDLLLILETLFARDRSFYIDFNYQQLQDIIISSCTN